MHVRAQNAILHHRTLARPTMRPTYSALSGRIQQLLSRLHPPSPPTAQESNRLLTVLRKSFQKELDTKHPNPAEASNASAASKHEIPISTSGELWQSNRQHWQSLISKLASPLEDQLDAKAQALRRLDSLLMQTSVDINRLEALLYWYRNEWRAKRITVTGPHVSDPFFERLDDWLHTTSMENRKMFFTTNGCLSAAIRTLFQQRNEALLWKWLRLVYERKLIDAPLTSPGWLHVEDQLVSGLMRIAIHRGELNDAAQQFLHACQYRLESGRANPGRHTGSDAHAHALPQVYMLSSAWRIANIIIWHGHEHHIKPVLFDGIGRFLPPWALKPDASHSLCMVYHPTDPCFQGLYRHLASPRAGSSWVAVQAKAPDIWRRACMTTLLDASNLALQKGMKAEASFLLNFAIDHYPDILPPRQFDDLEPQLEKSKTHAHRTATRLSPNIVKYTSLSRWGAGERVPNVGLDVG